MIGRSIAAVVDEQKRYVWGGRIVSVQDRIKHLVRLKAVISRYEAELLRALKSD